MSTPDRIIVLDDDPTGIQTVHGCLLITRWDRLTLTRAFEDACPFFYVFTNTRAQSVEAARKCIAGAVRGILDLNQDFGFQLLFISRSDSTLRSHFPLEITTIRHELDRWGAPPVDGIFLLPAFFEAGRVTRHDTHYLVEGQRLIPTSETEFASDAVFGYSSSHLPSYIAEKTAGEVDAAEVLSVSLDALRAPDVGALTARLRQVEHGRYVVVNAEQYTDLQRFAAVVQTLMTEGKHFLFHSAASFVKALTHTPDKALVREEIRVKTGIGIILAGSYVHKTSAQLQRLCTFSGVQPIEIDVPALLTEALDREFDQVLGQIQAAVQQGRTPVVFTSRQEINGATPEQRLQAGQRISGFIVRIVRQLPWNPAYIVAKGGITSHDILVQGLDVTSARVLGQILPGIPVIALPSEHRFGAIPYIIFPGNVGDADSLAAIYQILHPGEFPGDQSPGSVLQDAEAP